MKQGKATKPLHLPHRAPLCFVSQAQWNQYRELAVLSASNGFTFCTDCTPEHKAAMQARGRCAWPRTTFYTISGILLGKRVK